MKIILKVKKSERNSLEKSAFVGCSVPGHFSCFHTIGLNPLLWVKMYVLTFQNVCLITILIGQNLGSILLLFAWKEENMSLNI